MPSLTALLNSDIEVAAVVTNPDRPAGRGMKLKASPIKEVAEQHGVSVLQPTSAKDPGFHSAIAAIQADVATVVAYGKILPVALLEIPARGFVNLHFSLLPEYRGAAPVQRAVMDGRDRTGACIIVLTEGMDEGPVLSCVDTSIGDAETAGSVGERLAELGAQLLIETLPAYLSGALQPKPQDHARATYASKLTPDACRIDWSQTSAGIDAHVRGLAPTPGAWAMWRGSRLKVLKVRPTEQRGLAPGELAHDGDLVVGTGTNAVTLMEVQPAGKRRMSGVDFARGARPEPGEMLS